MTKTHKKILGFAGLSLVAAVTTVAAVLPTPGAFAANTYTDKVQVRVVPAESDIQVNPADGGEINTSNYEFDVDYNGISDIKAVLVNKDADGNVIFGPVEIWHIDAGLDPGSKHFSINLDDYGKYGNFTITITGVGRGGVPVEKNTTVRYVKKSEQKEEGGDIDVDPESGNTEVDIPVDVPTSEVETISVNIYDSEGNIVKTITISDPSEAENLDLSDLPNGTYTMEVVSRDGNGNVVKTDSAPVVVDTQSGQQQDVGVDITIKDQEEEVGKVVITVVNEETGEVEKTIEVDDPSSGDVVNVDLSDIEGGKYEVIVDYYDDNGEKIDSTTTPVTKTDSEGNATIEVEKEVNTVTTIEATIYDEEGNIVRVIKADRETGIVYVYDGEGRLLYTIADGYKNDKDLTIPMEGLEDGEYTTVISYEDMNGRQVGNSKSYTIKNYSGSAVLVPDTGGFFQGLNISREDYLITGLAVFMVIGVVAFGVVARNRRNKKVIKRSKR